MRFVLSRLLHLWAAPWLLLLVAASANSQTDSKPTDSGSFLNLVIKLRDKEVPEVVKAKEVPGNVILRQDRVSDYFYEVTKEGRTVAVGFLSEDPFAIRSFRGTEQQQEAGKKADNATIVVNVPQTGITSAESGKVAIRIYRINAGVDVQTITPAELKELRADNQVALKFEITGHDLSRAVATKQ